MIYEELSSHPHAQGWPVNYDKQFAADAEAALRRHPSEVDDVGNLNIILVSFL